MHMAVLAASITGWSHAELMELDLCELRSVIDIGEQAGFLKREK